MSLKDFLQPQSLYYSSIYGKNPNVLYAKQKDIKKSFEPYLNFLNRAIEAENEREVFVYFEIVENLKTITLLPVTRKFQIISNGKIRIFPTENVLFRIENIREILDNYPGFLNDSTLKFKMVEPEFKEITINQNQLIVGKDEIQDEVYLDLEIESENEPIIYYEQIKLDLSELLSNLEYKLIKQLDNILYINETIPQDDGSIILSFTGSFNKDFPILIDNIEYDNNDYEVLESFNMNELGKIEVINSNNTIIEKSPRFKDYEKSEVIIDADYRDDVKIYSQSDILLNIKEITNENISSVKDIETKTEFLLEQIDFSEYKILNESEIFPENQKIVEANNKNLFKTRINIREERDLKIRLIDPFEEDEGNDELSSKSNVDYFFEDDVREVMLKKNYGEAKKFNLLFSIDRRIKDENIIVLKTRSQSAYNIVKEKLTKYKKTRLYLNRNPYQLRMQLNFINRLLMKPFPEYAPLLRLSDSKIYSEKDWKQPNEIAIDHFYLLDDESIEGKEPQQRFVKKALGTHDFAFLEGPPGSGKTTTIIEIIFQLINNNKKVILAASTHVAIDNVLKRIKKEFPEMLGKILPLRIGDQSIIDENIREFQIDNILVEDDNEFNELILDSANLVCGTTVGILKHPWFDIFSEHNKPIQPLFDYLIIDESSKTTFQEFIIPALFAKRWILVGDIQQLAPYAEQDYLKRYFEKLVDFKNRPVFPDSNQKANFYIFSTLFDLLEDKRKINYKYRYDKFWFTTDAETLLYLKNEILKRFNEYIAKNNNNQLNLPKIVILSKEKISTQENLFLITISKNELETKPEMSVYLELANVIAVENDFQDKIENTIPKQFMLLNKKNWKSNKQVYRFQYYLSNSFLSKNEYKLLKIHRNKNKLFEKKSDWPSELSWRIIRLHELRNVENYGNKYEKEVNFLLPRTIELTSYLLNAYSIALPSILESIQKGLPDKRKGSDSILKSGFPENSFLSRHEKLEYQFRMHPQISSFPSKEFYGGIALKDSLLVQNNRDWEYKVYKSRSVWINVHTQTRKSSVNAYEASILAKELNRFIEWAKINKRKDGTNYTVICITYYRGQERLLRKELQSLTNQRTRISNFNLANVEIVLKTVDKIQGEEADIVFLSLTRPALYDEGDHRGGNLGFMDNPNRLNVAITRAKFQLVIIGDYINFNEQNRSVNYNNLTNEIEVLNKKNSKQFTIKRDKGISKTSPITNPQYHYNKNPKKKKYFRNDNKRNQGRRY